MTLPIWAHRRNHQYGRIVMGGSGGNSMSSCQATMQATECDDDSIAYHFYVSSRESYYCSPTGGKLDSEGGVDVMTCASAFYGSKGAYAGAGAFSLYPPRADLTAFEPHDSVDAQGYSAANDVVAVSGATPAASAMTVVQWPSAAPGDYVIWIEASLEGDVNAYHNYAAFADPHPELAAYGKIRAFGQPSVVYRVPIHIGAQPSAAAVGTYDGYADWDGATGTLHPPDVTITTTDGSGAGRLLPLSAADPNRVHVEMPAL
jgi:hypothetical protein